MSERREPLWEIYRKMRMLVQHFQMEYGLDVEINVAVPPAFLAQLKERGSLSTGTWRTDSVYASNVKFQFSGASKGTIEAKRGGL